jgi:hypothetical protein
VVSKAFHSFGALSVHLGSLNHSFKFDSRCFTRPKLNGLVAASLSLSRARTGILQFYPVPESSYSTIAVEEFEHTVVPHLVSWLRDQIEKPETAVLGHEEIIISWNGVKHEYAQVRFL